MNVFKIIFVIKQMPQLQVVYINEYAWRVSNIDDKQNISAFF